MNVLYEPIVPVSVQPRSQYVKLLLYPTSVLLFAPTGTSFRAGIKLF